MSRFRIKANQRKRKLRMLRQKSFRKCAYCGKQLTKSTATVDHIIPLSKGGRDSKSNRTLACHDCNQKKGNKILTP